MPASKIIVPDIRYVHASGTSDEGDWYLMRFNTLDALTAFVNAVDWVADRNLVFLFAEHREDGHFYAHYKEVE